MARLQGKTAVVTGAAQGMGEAIARRFVQEGARVVLADIQADRGAAVAMELGPDAAFKQTDVTRTADWTALVAFAAERFGGVDILVNNAGGAPGVLPLRAEDEAAHRHMLDLNLTGVWAGMRAVVPAMTARGGGSIVNISSIDGIVGVAEMTTYAATKFAVTGMTRSVALEMGKHGIRVNSVHPGVIATPLVLSAGPAGRERLNRTVAGQPIPRMGKPEEIAAAVLFFASDEASYCTGASLVVDGGHIAGPPREPVGG
jgi:3alpha(or 20beta)-hydroxysteroid dehydrogenase